MNDYGNRVERGLKTWVWST